MDAKATIECSFWVINSENIILTRDIIVTKEISDKIRACASSDPNKLPNNNIINSAIGLCGQFQDNRAQFPGARLERRDQTDGGNQLDPPKTNIRPTPENHYGIERER